MKAPPAHRLAKYGASVEDWQEVLALQGYACGACRRPFGPRRSPCTDHDHNTGNFRGLLDHRCNDQVLGQLGDDVTLFQGVVAYLLDPPAARLDGPRRRVPGGPPTS